MRRKEEKNTIIEICPVRNVIARFGNKWALLVILILSENKVLRFSELKKMIPDVSSRMLSSTLRTLEADGLVSRKVYPEVPPKVEYSLTETGLSLVCILISTFGIYSLVSLATEQRRKEIAIRKVNGATFYHILQLFFREYFILVTLGNVFALPVGYLVIKRWLETYANHTTLPAGLFLLVFLITCGIVLLSIFRQVKRAAATNPAEVIKTE